jgi:hypothetical protein
MTGWHEFWGGYRILRSRLSLLRLCLFGLLAADLSLVMLPHASRYGAGGFNVPHPSLLAPLLPIPSPDVVGALWLLAGFLSLRVALGISARGSAIGVCVLYVGVYLWSQIDSYQHHYFISLLLVSFCFVPHRDLVGWDRIPPDGGRDLEVTSWAARMLYVTLGLMYFWAAVAKTDASWLDGTTMHQILSSRTTAMAIMRELGGGVGLDLKQCLILASWGSMLTEYFLAIAVLWKRLWWVAFWLAPAFHFSIELLELQIEWFSYYMVALTFVMFLPEPWMRAVARGFTRATARVRSRISALRQPRAVNRLRGTGLAIAAAALAVALLIDFPLEGRVYVSSGIGLAILLSQMPRSGQPMVAPIARAMLQVALVGALLLPITRLGVGFDYYRYWGGDLRRRGDLEATARAYAKANALKPAGEARHVELGEVLEQLGRLDAAEVAYAIGLQRRAEANERALNSVTAARGDDDVLALARKAAARTERRKAQTERALERVRSRRP